MHSPHFDAADAACVFGEFHPSRAAHAAAFWKRRDFG
jgi:hypothetical protein